MLWNAPRKIVQLQTRLWHDDVEDCVGLIISGILTSFCFTEISNAVSLASSANL